MPASFYNQSPINMLDPFDWLGLMNAVASSSHSSTSWSATNGGEVWQFTGTGFSNYQSNIPFSGTITGITYTVNGVTTFSVTGASQSVNTFLTQGAAGNYFVAVAGLYPGADNVTGTSGNDLLDGFAGNDTLDGAAGNDTIYGGAGVDVIHGGAGADELRGEAGADQLFGDADNDLIFADAGDLADGGEGIDRVYFSASGLALAPELWSTSTGQTLSDGTIIRNFEMFTIYADSLTISPVFATAPGYSPQNYVEFTNTLTLNFSGSAAAIYMIQVSTSQSNVVVGGVLGDLWLMIHDLGYPNSSYHITGSSGDDILIGGGGADILNGGAGGDSLLGYAGSDTMSGGDGNDSMFVDLFGHDVVDGGAGVDWVFFNTDAITLDMSLTTEQKVTLQQSASDAAYVTLSNVENAFGTNQGDTIYGSSGANVINGGEGDDLLRGGAGADTLIGGGGFDTVDYSTSPQAVSIALAGGGTGGDAQGDVLSGFEAAIGSALADTLVGSSEANSLQGGGGDDLLVGGGGADVLNGGSGADTASYAGASVGVLASLTTPASNTGDAAGDTFTSIEGLAGSSLGDTLIGDGNANTLSGGDGDDVLEGRAGADVLDGGQGADTASYANSATGVTVNLTSGVGSGGDAQGDAFTSIENLLGSAQSDALTGDSGANVLTGGGGADVLTGLDGADVLDGGAGADTMVGGLGDDSYAVDDAGDVVTEQSGEGTDTIVTAMSFTLAVNFENLTLTGVANLNGVGNAAANVLIGNGGANTLTGGDGDDTLNGGGGADTMIGGVGNDNYYVDSAGDVVTEQSGEGTDTVFSAMTYTLGADIENLTLTGTSGIGGVGNDGANVLTGNSGANTLTGGAGDDTLNGGDGDDTLNGGLGSDAINAGAGNDQIYYGVDEGVDTLDGGAGGDTLNVTGSAADTALNVTLSGSHLTQLLGVDLTSIEVVYLDMGTGVDGIVYNTTENVYVNLVGGSATGFVSIAGVENVVGGDGNDQLVGNAADNALTGAAGADFLFGGEGNDTLSGGFDADAVIGAGGDDVVNYGVEDGADSVDGGGGTDTLNVIGSSAESILYATFDGARLTHVIDASLSNIEIVNADMGGGTDWLIYTTSAAVSVDLGAGTGSGFSSLLGVDNIIAGNFADTLTGSSGANRIDGGAGNDVIAGGAGADTLLGGEGDDTISGGFDNDSINGGAGNDIINWSLTDGRDVVDGGADSDAFNVTGSASAEVSFASWDGSSLTALMDNSLSNIESVNLDLLGGVDWLVYVAGSAGVVVDLSAHTASGFASISNIEKIIGAGGGDTLTGDALDNRLDGQGGNDILDGGGGSDSVLGGDGADTIYASAGNDSLQGQNGDDTFYWTASDGRDTFNGGAGTDTVYLTGSAVADVADTTWNGVEITGLMNNALIEIETVHLDLGAGGSGGDWLRYYTSLGISVDLGAGTATGYASIAGVENLIGGTGNDVLIGDGGANKINGNNGDDTITGGGGNDNLTGGAGNDVFVYGAAPGNDTINDFDAWAVGGQDLLDISALGVTAANFASRVAIIDTGADTVIRIDGSIFITLKSVSGDGDNSISQADFILGP